MELTIEVTSRCHNDCIHCSSVASLASTDFISAEQVSDALHSVQPDRVILSGGEPFLHPGIETIISTIKKNNSILCINTCGVFKYKNIPRNIRAIDEFYVSWFGDDNEKITRFDPPLAFMHPFSLIMYAKAWKKLVWINTVVMGGWQVDEIPRACFNLAVPVHVMRLIHHGNAKTFPRMALDRQREIATTIIDQLDPERVITRVPSFLGKHAEEVLPEDIERLAEIHPRCKMSHAFFPGQCRSTEKRTLLPDGRLIGCVGGKGVDETIGTSRACDKC